MKTGHLAEAEKHCRAILSSRPNDVEALHILGHVALQAGHYPSAGNIFDTLTDLKPDNADFAATAGGLNLALNKTGRARELFERALARKPNHGEALKGLGQMALQAGQLAEAIPYLEKAERKLAKDPDLLNALGLALANTGQPRKAIKKFSALTKLVPNNSDFWNNLGNAQQAAGDSAKSVSSYEKALRLSPQSLQALYNLGLVYNGQKEPLRALDYLNKAHALAPGNPEVLCAMGISQSLLGHHSQAAELIAQAIEAAPNSAEFRENMGKIWMHFGDAEKACENWDKAFAIKADRFANTPHDILGATPSSLFYSNCIEHQTALALFEKTRRWAQIVMDSQTESAKAPMENPNPQRPLRIGFVSPDFREHSVRYFFLPLIENWGDSSIEVYCYAHIEKPDDITKRIKKAANRWLDITALSDREAAEQIRKDKIDIAIDLAGYCKNTRLGALAYRPAPVQMTWLGYPNTTGMQAIDYRIVDEFTDPSGQSEVLNTEELLRLEPSFLCYEAPQAAGEITDPPSLSKGYVTFCSFNNRMKIQPGTLEAWASVLKQVPRSRLILKDPCFDSDESKQAILEPLMEAGIEPDRIDLLTRLASKEDHFSLYGQADIALDTFPYNGTTTTFEALWMGLPVITHSGDRHAARVGESILRNLGYDEFVAADWESYIRLAVNLAADTNRIAELRNKQRERLLKSRLMDGPRFAEIFTKKMRSTWEKNCTAISD